MQVSTSLGATSKFKCMWPAYLQEHPFSFSARHLLHFLVANLLLLAALLTCLTHGSKICGYSCVVGGSTSPEPGQKGKNRATTNQLSHAAISFAQRIILTNDSLGMISVRLGEYNILETECITFEGRHLDASASSEPTLAAPPHFLSRCLKGF